MIRWKKLAPRLILAALVPLALFVFANPLLRYFVVQRCESLAGAETNIGSVRVNWFCGKVQISDFRIADPRNPSKNLMQADTVLFTFNPVWLWRREFVVDQGIMCHLQFDTPRQSAAQSAKVQFRETSLVPWISREYELKLAKLNQQFISHLSAPEFEPQIPRLNLLRVADELRARWLFVCNDQRIVAESVKIHLANFASALHAPRGNPLRDAEEILILGNQLRNAEKDLSQANESLARLRDQIANDRCRLLDAKIADAQVIRQRESKRFVDGQTLSKILVGPGQKDRINEVLTWIRWLRSTTLDSERDFRQAAGRGVDVQFLPRSRPTFLIRAIEFDATGIFGGQSFHLVGGIRNLALQPRLLPDPCVVELRTHSGGSLVVRGVLDRRSQEKIDHITLECSNLSLPRQALGLENGLSIDVGQSRLAASVDIRVHGDAIDGTMNLKQSDAVMRVRQTQLPLASREMTTGLDRELRSIREFSTEIRLGGNLDNVQVEIASDLGPKLGPATAKIAQQQAEIAKHEHLAKLDALYQSKLAQFNQESQSHLDDVSELLKAEQIRLAELDRLVPPTDGLNRIR